MAAQERDVEARKSNYLKKQWNAVGYGMWEARYKRRTITIGRDSFRGHEYYVISMGGDCYQWKDNFLTAQHFAFDLIEWEETWRET